MTTPLWVVNTRLKLQGATFRTKGLDDNKTKKYKGIIGKSTFTVILSSKLPKSTILIF